MNPALTHPRLTGIGERIAYALITFILVRAVNRGWLPAEMVEYVATGLIGGVGAVYAWWINRPKAILEAAANVPNPQSPTGKTEIVTAPELANAMPATNVMASDRAQVVSK